MYKCVHHLIIRSIGNIYLYTMDYLRSIDLRDRQSQLTVAAGAVGALGASYLIRRAIKARREAAPIKAGPFTPETLPKDCYDAIIVGAGPCYIVCGSACHSGNAWQRPLAMSCRWSRCCP